MQTPKQRATGLQRPSFGNTNTASSPSLRASIADVHRKSGQRALTGNSGPSTPVNNMDAGELEVGDAVNVPGDMYGTVKFIGSVRGKNGKFVGVELDRHFAARGKNDGDVEGIYYFKTSVPGAGIFLPVHRAEKRLSASGESYLGTPSTPSYSTYNGVRTNGTNPYTPPTPAVQNKKFSQSVGPGARPSSPAFKPKRPSLPRPESPLRRQPNLAPTPARHLSQSQLGGRPALSATPSKSNFKSSTSGRPPVGAAAAAPPPPRPYSRSGSRLGSRNGTIEEDDRTPTGVANGRTTSSGTIPSFSQPLRSPSRLGSAGGQDAEIQKLRAHLAERDLRLNEQAASLTEMENSVRELSALLPPDGMTPTQTEEDDKSATQLRQMLREKNEKISKLTAEFDAHRADFRSTLDSLEMASTETERVYEEQKRDLLAQVADLQETNQSREDFEGVAQQLKQLEDLVAELEEGLEESRRGEAEARGEVEFLRGEVERGRSELRRERDKAAAALKHASITSTGSSVKDLEQRDDEIRGLKAIIHSLSESGGAGGGAAPGNASTNVTTLDEVNGLRSELDHSQREKEALEKELEQLRRDHAHLNGNTAHVHARNVSEMTEKALGNRPRSETIKAVPTALRNGASGDAGSKETTTTAHGNDEIFGGTFCEMCESADHDTLDCTKLSSSNSKGFNAAPASQQDTPTSNKPSTDMGKENQGIAATEAETQADPDKWCALCEKDGHLAFDCPEEQY